MIPSKQRTPKERKTYLRNYYLLNKERVELKKKIWRDKNRKKLRKRARQLRGENLDRYRSYEAKYRAKNRKKATERSRLSESKKPEMYRLKHRIYTRKYRLVYFKNYPNAQIALNLRRRVGKAIISQKARKFGRLLEFIGCSLEEVRNHIQKQFIGEMCWGNYGKWHIDHIKPLTTFNLLLEEEQKKAFHYTNLQPMWAIDNLKKGKKYDGN